MVYEKIINPLIIYYFLNKWKSQQSPPKIQPIEPYASNETPVATLWVTESVLHIDI